MQKIRDFVSLMMFDGSAQVSLCSRTILLNGDLLCRGSHGLGNEHGQDAVLQAGHDSVLVDTSREGEGALELADGALTDPVARLVGGLLGGNLLLVGLCNLAAFALGRLLGLGLLSLVLVAGVVLALRPALDHQGLRVGELHVNVALWYTREFTVKVVGLAGFTNIEARGERPLGSLAARAAVGVVVVKETEERREVSRSRNSSEERHC
jgi:hypothetical protein